MSRLLWVGDAGVESGFGRCTHKIVPALVADGWQVSVLALNYLGDPHPMQQLVSMYPCYPGGDGMGIGRMEELIRKIQPDVIVVQSDPWNFPAYVQKAGSVPVVGAVAVDGLNCAGRSLNKLAHAVFWTNFGMNEAVQGGYTGSAEVIGLGVDRDIYYPMNKIPARRMMGLPAELDNAFIVGNVNRNHPRKRLDLTMMYFADWIREQKVDDAYLYLHAAPTSELNVQIGPLAHYLGIADRVIIMEPDISQGITEQGLCTTYNTFDVQITTTLGEGWGLPTMEGMACGIPQIVPQWSGLGEWATSAIQVPCSGRSINHVNVVGGVADRRAIVDALSAIYHHPELRAAHSEAGMVQVGKLGSNWSHIGTQWARAVERVFEVAV